MVQSRTTAFALCLLSRVMGSPLLLLYVLDMNVDRDSVAGTTSRCRLDGLGIESRWWRDFPHPSRPALVPTQPPVQ
jgi:hypothetical protein